MDAGRTQTQCQVISWQYYTLFLRELHVFHQQHNALLANELETRIFRLLRQHKIQRRSILFLTYIHTYKHSILLKHASLTQHLKDAALQKGRDS